MAQTLAWRDIGKKLKDLNSKYFPSVGKDKNLRDGLNFKVSSKAQKGVEFETKVNNYNQETTEAEFSAKAKFDDLEGVQLGLKAKNKPALEFSLKLTDKLLPVDGLSVTLKDSAAGSSEQTAGVDINYANEVVNGKLGFTYPITKKFVDFLDDSDESDLAKQQIKLNTEVVVKPLADRPYYLAGEGSFNVSNEHKPHLFDAKFGVVYQTDDFFGVVYGASKKQLAKDKLSVQYETNVGAAVYTEVDDLSVSGGINYTLGKSDEKYKGVSLKTAASLKRDENSKVSAQVKIIPDTTVSLGYQQKLSNNVEVNFGYAFLLAKASEEEKTKSSAFNFGVEFSH